MRESEVEEEDVMERNTEERDPSIAGWEITGFAMLFFPRFFFFVFLTSSSLPLFLLLSCTFRIFYFLSASIVQNHFHLLLVLGALINNFPRLFASLIDPRSTSTHRVPGSCLLQSIPIDNRAPLPPTHSPFSLLPSPFSFFEYTYLPVNYFPAISSVFLPLIFPYYRCITATAWDVPVSLSVLV